MAMETVTGHRSGERPAWAARRDAGVSARKASAAGVVGDGGPGNGPAVGAGRRPVRSVERRGPAVCADSHAPDLHGSRLTPRGRVVVALVWLAMAVVAALMVATVPGDGSAAPVVTTKVMVEPGVTLWDLAGDVQSGGDRQGTVAAIMSLNDLESASQIRPGDILLVPVER